METNTVHEPSTLSERVSRTAVRFYDARIDLILSLLISLAALSSAWCAYQANAWSGTQAANTVQGNRLSTQATRLFNQSLQQSSIDVACFLQYLEAYSAGNTELADFLLQRFRPEFKTALNAWLATKPLENPDAPTTPFAMDEYVLATQVESQHNSDLAAEQFDLALQANQRSRNYVSLTVLFATVLFFGGIALKNEARSVRRILGAVAILIFVIAFVVVISYPRMT